MLIEYKIKFEKDGLTIAQHIQPDAPAVAPARATNAQVNGLPATQKEVTARATTNPLAQGGAPADPTGGAPADPTGGAPADPTGGGVPGSSAPIFILGPIVFGNAAPPELAKPVEPTVDSAPKALGTTAGK